MRIEGSSNVVRLPEPLWADEDDVDVGDEDDDDKTEVLNLLAEVNEVEVGVGRGDEVV